MRTIQQLFDLKGKTALITGGSRGLGLQIAEALGEQGARIERGGLDPRLVHADSGNGFHDLSASLQS